MIVKKKRQRRSANSNPQKEYFGDREEQAIVAYLTTQDAELKNKLFRSVINPALKHLVQGVMRMPKFQKIIGITPEQLEEEAYYHLVFQMAKFKIGNIGKDGKPVRAYSYYGTIVKNYVLGEKIRLDKIANERGLTMDIEDAPEIEYDDTPIQADLDELRRCIIDEISYAMDQDKINHYDVIVGNTLKYMITNWHKLEFQTKNEFTRLLCQYCQLDSVNVGRSLKKFKISIQDNFFNKSMPDHIDARPKAKLPIIPLPVEEKKSKKIKKVKILKPEGIVAEILQNAEYSRSAKMRALFDNGVIGTKQIAVLTGGHLAFVCNVIKKYREDLKKLES